MMQHCWCGHNSWQHRKGPCSMCAVLRVPSHGVCSRFAINWEMDNSFDYWASTEFSYGKDMMCFCGHPLAHHGPNAILRPCGRMTTGRVFGGRTLVVESVCRCPHFFMLEHDRRLFVTSTKAERVWPFVDAMRPGIAGLEERLRYESAERWSADPEHWFCGEPGCSLHAFHWHETADAR